MDDFNQFKGTLVGTRNFDPDQGEIEENCIRLTGSLGYWVWTGIVKLDGGKDITGDYSVQITGSVVVRTKLHDSELGRAGWVQCEVTELIRDWATSRERVLTTSGYMKVFKGE